ncbi:MAG: iron-containing alcohol dehydrogenase, partial [Spirochaetota bacterium]|nr:iron-containing alcohol dehydrogenase [Spirochaetota bacterium]
SVIDTAKGVNIIVSENSSDIARFIGNECLESPQKPLLAIPTTTGTGSEASYVAVITDTKTDTKMFFLSYHLFPRVAILDPRMTQTCPASIIAATAMDALSHAMEAYIGLQKNPMSDAYAISAINLIREHLLEAVKESKSGNHRFGLANAACMAGIAFSSSMPGVVHTLGQAVGAVCHLHHGAAMAIFLPIGLEYNLAKRATEIGELLLPLGGRDIYANTPQESRHTKVIELVKDLRLSLSQLTKLPISLSQAGVDRERFEDISKYAVGDGTILYNAEDISYDDILQLLEKAYD